MSNRLDTSCQPDSAEFGVEERGGVEVFMAVAQRVRAGSTDQILWAFKGGGYTI